MNFRTADLLTAVFWTCVYVFVIISTVQKKNLTIPVYSVILNYAWETVALISEVVHRNYSAFGFWCYLVWFVLDTVIVVLYLVLIRMQKREKIRFILYAAVCMTLLVFTRYFSYFLFFASVYLIDLIMAIEWYVFIRKQRRYAVGGWDLIICVFRLTGDVFAWIAYREYHFLLDYACAAVLLFNVLCGMAIIGKMKACHCE